MNSRDEENRLLKVSQDTTLPRSARIEAAERRARVIEMRYGSSAMSKAAWAYAENLA